MVSVFQVQARMLESNSVLAEACVPAAPATMSDVLLTLFHLVSVLSRCHTLPQALQVRATGRGCITGTEPKFVCSVTVGSKSGQRLLMARSFPLIFKSFHAEATPFSGMELAACS